MWEEFQGRKGELNRAAKKANEVSNERCSLGGRGSWAEVEVRKRAHSLTEEVEDGSVNRKPLKQFGLKVSETVAGSG